MKFLKLMIFFFFILHTSYFILLNANDVPAAYKGRFRPMEAYARLWLNDIYHRQKIKTEHQQLFPSDISSAADLLWNIHFLGHTPWDNAPLFRVHSSQLKTLLGLDPSIDYFSYIQLQQAYRQAKPEQLDTTNKKNAEDSRSLQSVLEQFSLLEGQDILVESAYEDAYKKLAGQNMAPKEISFNLEAQYPLVQRLAQSGTTLRLLPGRYQPGLWYSLKALKLRIYSPELNRLVPAGNFTTYTDDQFEKIRSLFLELEQTVLSAKKSADVNSSIDALSREIMSGYTSIAGTPFQVAFGKQLKYPTMNMLQAETFYYSYPWLEICMGLYALALIAFFLAYTSGGSMMEPCAVALLAMAFLLHTFILALRCYILQRPPVSNMFETVIYVPWIAVMAGFILRIAFKSSIVLASSALISLALLAVLKLTDINSSLENVQAVLDSQYWLIIHVLMVVGSYGLFCLSGILGHIYLISYALNRQETDQMRVVNRLLLQSMYLGLALLITGTILGGVWAAESWGRFWDWDPKESWAFISICVYLIWVHAYTFQHIRNFGLAVGSIIGLQAISFTWYGVNYILGTGLHSYGFGSGGEHYYYLFLSIEALFLILICVLTQSHRGTEKKRKER